MAGALFHMGGGELHRVFAARSFPPVLGRHLAPRARGAVARPRSPSRQRADVPLSAPAGQRRTTPTGPGAPVAGARYAIRSRSSAPVKGSAARSPSPSSPPPSGGPWFHSAVATQDGARAKNLHRVERGPTLPPAPLDRWQTARTASRRRGLRPVRAVARQGRSSLSVYRKATRSPRLSARSSRGAVDARAVSSAPTSSAGGSTSRWPGRRTSCGRDVRREVGTDPAAHPVDGVALNAAFLVEAPASRPPGPGSSPRRAALPPAGSSGPQ